jgi:hypothetical protein
MDTMPTLISPFLATDPPHRVAPGLLRRRLAMLVFGPIALAAFWKAGDLLAIPRDGGYSGSLIDGSGMGPLAAVLVLLVALTCVYALLIGRIATDAPLACAVLGLAALSWRGGSMRDTLIAAGNRGAYLTLFGELMLLYAGIAIAKVLSAIVLRDSHPPRGSAPNSVAPSRLVATVAVHALVTLLLIEFLARSDAKLQVTAAILIASAVASVAARVLVGATSATGCWIGPMVAAMIGYLAAYGAGSNGLLSIGLTGGYLAPLARGLPLDYAAIGTAGAIIGFWWARDMEAPIEEPSPGGTEPAQGPKPFDAASGAA